MAATTTQHISKLVEQCKTDFDYSFLSGTTFKWSSQDKCITYPQITSSEDFWTLLHEIAHAELNHYDFKLDIELLSLETQAWIYAAKTLAPRYGVTLSHDFIEDNLDTYREWAHMRSICPDCTQNGVQQKTGTYQCLNCKCLWGATESRDCLS